MFCTLLVITSHPRGSSTFSDRDHVINKREMRKATDRRNVNDNQPVAVELLSWWIERPRGQMLRIPPWTAIRSPTVITLGFIIYCIS